MGNPYIYASSYIRSCESKLLREEQLRSLCDAKSVDDIFKVLQDAGYDADGKALTIGNYQEALEQAEHEMFDEVTELSKGQPAVDVFRYPSDYHNIKVLLKAEGLGIERTDILMENGTIPAEEMVRSIRERDFISLTPHMAEAVTMAVDTHARTSDPQYIDCICDRYCYEDIREAAERSENDFVRGYVERRIDTLNWMTFLRCRWMERPWSFFEEVFLEGGSIGKPVFNGAYEDDDKHVGEHFTATVLGDIVSDGLEAMAKDGTFTRMEKLCDDLLMEYAGEAKTVTFGIEPLVAYIIAKQNEIRCIRILLAGRVASMDPEVIRERLRETYE